MNPYQIPLNARERDVERIPARFESLDERFASISGDNFLLRLHTGCRWVEGPAYFPAGRYLLFSDSPNDRVLKYDETTGQTSAFLYPSGYHNGHSVDQQGRLLSCEHGARRISRTEADGSITVLADRYDGKRLNSPNDIVEHHDGSVWFSDPSYGIQTDFEGFAAEQEQDGCYLFRVVPGEQPTVAADDFAMPNGLAFSLDHTKLYVSDTGDGRHHIRVFDVDERGRLHGGEVFAECTAGVFDGFRLDAAGRLWCSSAEGVHVLDPDGTLLGKVHVPELVANLTFGGPKNTDLYLCGSTSLYTLRLRLQGAPFPH